MSAIERLIQNNSEWVARISAQDQAFSPTSSSTRI